jgi:hypothetical protein
MNSNSNYETVQTVVKALLATEPAPSPERIRELIARYAKLNPISEADAERLARQLEVIYQVQMDVGAVLTDHSFEPWLEASRAGADPYYWSRYKELLSHRNFNPQVLGSLDEVTDRVLGLLENPQKKGSWDRRGMVVGHVQSGKTANYTGVVCKAADAGYKLIIVIAGVHNNLRNQTQQRIDEGFVGRDSSVIGKGAGDRIIGVGKFDARRRPVTFTSSTKDFNQALAEAVGVQIQNLNEPAVLVIKKNTSTLKNLVKWLREHNIAPNKDRIDVPMLLIDDEADNASINIRWGKDGVARINGQIRELLNTFEKSCYVGYTATPFANIFIDPDTDDEMFKGDLFPENFIVSLDPPSNYFGPTKVFLEEPDEFVRSIDDNEDSLPLKHKIDFWPTDLPDSMMEAIRCFVLVRAIRLARGDATSHNSMLINASRFTGVQERLRNDVHVYVSSLQDAIRLKGGEPFRDSMADPTIAALHSTWQKEYSGLSESWHDIYPHLHPGAAPVKVVSVNSASAGKLNYHDYKKTGLNIIAVGGYSLSRGLTLEGLSISYFLRNSVMYDTLLQMGRWFGYRVGYEDLCRVWMQEEAAGWYAHIAEAVEELRSDLRQMEQIGATPREFGLKVRSHPTILLVTARNRMGAGQRLPVRVGLSNKFVETTTLRSSPEVLDTNRTVLGRLVADLGVIGFEASNTSKVGGNYLLKSVPFEPVVTFLSGFMNDPNSLLTETAPILRYISERTDKELLTWDILFAGVANAPPSRKRSRLLGPEIICQQRTAGDGYWKSNGSSIPVSNKQRVASRGIESYGLTDVQVKKAKDKFDEIPENLGKVLKDGTRNYPDRIFRSVRERPLLIVHLLELTEPKEARESKTANLAQEVSNRAELKNGPVIATEVVAWGISFPETDLEETLTEYIVNEIWLQEFMRDLDDLDDDYDQEELNV